MGDFFDIWENKKSKFKEVLNRVFYSVYQKRCEEMTSFNKLGGGDSRAADLIEIFIISPHFFISSTFGLSWIALYNLDIVALFISMLFTFILLLFSFSKKKEKTKKN